MSSQIILGQYLFTRLRQLGCTSIHGVPGDFNLTLLDHVVPSGLAWIGNCNELNAGYAADGYSRVKGLGALVTTFGVGELSAVNAIAGAYAELAPVVHIVGTPSRALQDGGVLMHHTFADGNYRRFAEMQVPITVAQTNLRDPRTAAEEVDRVLRECLLQSRPVYLELPTDMVEAKVDAERLEREIDVLGSVGEAAEAEEKVAVQAVLDRIHESERPMILADGESRSFGIKDEVNALVQYTGYPTFTTAFGKSLVEESHPNFHGIYSAHWSPKPEIAAQKAVFDSADLILCFGPHYSDTNSYGFTAIPPAAKTMTFRRTTLEIPSTAAGAKPRRFTDIRIKSLLARLVSALNKDPIPRYDASHYPPTLTHPFTILSSHPQPPSPSAPLTQDTFWLHLARLLPFQEGDILLAETGTAAYGARDIPLHPRSLYFGPTTWLSIGYMLPAAQGAAIAQAELLRSGKWPSPKGRTILFEGDGSLQMSAQEISTMIHQPSLTQPLIIFIVNNAGYTIERAIHGWKAAYNDVAPWRYTRAGDFFGAQLCDPPARRLVRGGVRSWVAETYEELERVVRSDGFGEGPGLRLVEVRFAPEDGPAALLKLTGNEPYKGPAPDAPAGEKEVGVAG